MCGTRGRASATFQELLRPQASGSQIKRFDKTVAKGQRKDSARAFETLAVMQAASDIFLGWLGEPPGIEDLKLHDLHLRHLWDSKTSVDISAMSPSDMSLYAGFCASALARAQARSGDSIAIASNLGSSEVFDRAIAAFAEAYADQNERDHAALLDGAIATGRVQAEPEPTTAVG
jgi:hypothetical protein